MPAALSTSDRHGFSVRDILRAIAAETGREVPHVIKPRRAGDPTYLVADPTAARETLKFRTLHSDSRPSSGPHGVAPQGSPLRTGTPSRTDTGLRRMRKL